MSLKDEFDKADENGERKPLENKPEIERYTTIGNARNLTFVQLNGNEEFFSYADLVNARYIKQDDEIRLVFRADTINSVTLKGSNLLKLFNGLAESLPKKISCMDKRYTATQEDNESIVTEIVIQRGEGDLKP